MLLPRSCNIKQTHRVEKRGVYSRNIIVLVFALGWSTQWNKVSNKPEPYGESYKVTRSRARLFYSWGGSQGQSRHLMSEWQVIKISLSGGWRRPSCTDAHTALLSAKHNKVVQVQTHTQKKRKKKNTNCIFLHFSASAQITAFETYLSFQEDSCSLGNWVFWPELT